MSLLEIKTYPDPCLKIKTKPVDRFDQELRKTLRQMADIMYMSQGIGLASTQVGLGVSMLTIDIGQGLMFMVNPEILERSKKKNVMEEGCLSLPGVTVKVARSEVIKVQAQDENGEYFTKKFDGLLAKVVQHEMDHLQGKLLMDYLDPVRAFFTSLGLRRRHNKKTCEVTCDVGRENI